MASSPPRDASAELQRFLSLQQCAVDASGDARVALFSLPGKYTFASRNLHDVAAQALALLDQRENVYIHTHLHQLPEGHGFSRGRLDTACVATGVWVDIDAVGPGRKKPLPTLCPTVDDALALVEAFNTQFTPLRASLVIRSGFGVYAAILFKEPCLIATSQDREMLESLGRRFRQAFHLLASERGWRGAVEYCDLAKVLRLPGTQNFKDSAHPQPVTIHALDSAAFTATDLDELLPPPEKKPREVRADSGNGSSGNGRVAMGKLVLDPNANPPEDKFRALAVFVLDFVPTWNHKRPLRDRSQSGYDLALADRGVWAEWSDQEIVDLLIANRRLHGAKPKLRPDYYMRTIAKARASAEAAAPLEDPEKPGADEDRPDQNADHEQESDAQASNGPQPREGNPHTPDPTPGDQSAAAPTGAAIGPQQHLLLAKLSRRLRFPILRLRRLSSEPAQYRLLTQKNGEPKEVKLGDVTELIQQTNLRNRMADAIGHYIPRFKPHTWDKIASILLKACDPEDLGEEATDRGQTEAWVTGYLVDQSLHPSLEESLGRNGENDSAHEPFFHEEAIWLRVEGLQQWLRIQRGERVKLTALTAALADCGFHRKKFNVSIGMARTTRMAWKVPGQIMNSVVRRPIPAEYAQDG
jgi:hypothetical protein